MLTQWLIDEFGVVFAPADGGPKGVPLADAMLQALVDAGLDYDRQRAVLHAAPTVLHDHRFGRRCLELCDEIGAFQRLLAATPAPAAAARTTARRHSAVIARDRRPPAKPFAELRFVASRPAADDVCTVVSDFCRRLVAEGYVRQRPDAERDLRQGLGYYRRGEDPLRQRQTLVWLHRQNELRHLFIRLLDDPAPLCLEPDSPDGRWQVCADLFCDRDGRRLYNNNLDHGELHDERRRRRLDALVPRLP